MLHHEEYLQSVDAAYMLLGGTSSWEVHNRFVPNGITGVAALLVRCPSEPPLSQNGNSVTWYIFSLQKTPWAYTSIQCN